LGLHSSSRLLLPAWFSSLLHGVRIVLLPLYKFFYVVQFFSASPNLTDVNMGTFTRTKRKQKLVYQVETDFDSNGGDESSCDTGPIGNDTEMFSAATANIEIEPASPLASVPSNEPIEDADINNDQPITSSVPDVTGVSRISEFPGICVSKTFW